MKNNFRIVLFLPLFLLPFLAYSQNPSLYVPRNIMQAFEKQTRSDDGKPGAKYWQNRADYTIKISFDPKTLLLRGAENITYINNSPDTLRKVVIHLYPDFYKKGFNRNYPIDEADENEGVVIEQLSAGKENIDLLNSSKADFSGTNLTIFPAVAILPKAKITCDILWHYTVNKGSHVRTGEVDSSSFFLAYTFPRIAVYDDIDGWNNFSYAGIQEFYNDFGNFDAEITVPRGFVVWATGELQNAKDLFSPRIFSNYETALSSDKIIHIIDSSDYRKGIVTADAPMLKWRFSARDVTDFAFALSDHYLWDGSSTVADKSTGRKVFVDATYDKSAKDFFEVADVARRSVDIMVNKYPAYPFPFPHQTIFNGLDQMEYPMMVNDNSTDTRTDMVQLTSHEVIHAYFPFYMGINETKHAWMDEGWATIGESVISPMLGEPEDDGIYMRKRYERIAGTDEEVPMITNSQLLSTTVYLTNSYGKPGLFYWTLQNLLGDEQFFKALHEFMNRWHGKHPIPYDFFNTFNSASGENLNWFFKPWFFETGFPDLAIKEVLREKDKWKVVIERKGIIPVPVNLTFVLENDSLVHLDNTAFVWRDGKTEFIVSEKLTGKLKEVRLGNDHIPDVEQADNTWVIGVNSR